MHTTIEPLNADCRDGPGRSARALIERARDLVVAAEAVRNAGASVDIDEDPRSAIALFGDALAHLRVAAMQLSRHSAAVASASDRGGVAEVERRMHELVSSLSYARYSAHLASREQPRAGRPRS